MAATQIIRGTGSNGSNAALVPKYWATKFLEGQHEKDPLKPFYGDGNIVNTDYNLLSEKGDIIEVPIVGLPDGAGVTDDGDYDSDIGNIALYDMPVQIHEHGRSLGLKGQMTEKSSAFKARTKTMNALVMWRSMFNARAVIDALSGMKLHKLGGNVLGASGLAMEGSTQIECVNQVSNVASMFSGNTANRYYCGGEKADGTYTGRISGVSSMSGASVLLMGPQVIEDVRRMARQSVTSAGTLLEPMQPVNVNGKALFIMLVSLKQGKALRGNTVWKNSHYYADVRGLENSIFSGQIGVYDNVMVIETDLLHQRTGSVDVHHGPAWFDASGTTGCVYSGSTVHRALFLGANAVAWAWGKAPEYKEFMADHAGTKWAARVTSIYGVRKISKMVSTTSTASAISDTDKGCIIVDTCVQ